MLQCTVLVAVLQLLYPAAALHSILQHITSYCTTIVTDIFRNVTHALLPAMLGQHKKGDPSCVPRCTHPYLQHLLPLRT